MSFKYGKNELKGSTFGDKENVKFVVDKITEKPKISAFSVNCTVVEGEKVGKKQTLDFFKYTKNNDPNPQTLAFLRAFFKDEELEQGVDFTVLQNKMFTAQHEIFKAKDGRELSNWKHFKDEGYADVEDAF